MSQIQIRCTYMRTTLTQDFTSISMLVAHCKKPFTVYGVLETELVGAHATTDGFSTPHNAYLDIRGM
jgi:hypothetical protein